MVIMGKAIFMVTLITAPSIMFLVFITALSITVPIPTTMDPVPQLIQMALMATQAIMALLVIMVAEEFRVRKQ